MNCCESSSVNPATHPRPQCAESLTNRAAAAKSFASMLETILMLISWPWDPPPPPPPPTLLEEWTPFLISSTGWLGFCLSLLNTQMPTAMLMAITQTINNATYMVHFALVGAWSGLATQVIGMTNGLLKIGA